MYYIELDYFWISGYLVAFPNKAVFGLIPSLKRFSTMILRGYLTFQGSVLWETVAKIQEV